MKFYLGDRLLFIDMNHYYTHCVVEGEDRVLCCHKSLSDAERVCREIRSQKFSKVREFRTLLDNGHAYSSDKKTAYGMDPKVLYPTSGLLFAAIRRMEKTANSIRVMPLTVSP